MKYRIHLLIILCSLFTLLSSFQSNKTVYICVSTATKYHYDKYCRGLSNCTHEIRAVSLTDAKNVGRTLCGWED